MDYSGKLETDYFAPDVLWMLKEDKGKERDFMKYRVELRGEHGERIIVGTVRNAESIQEVVARANRMN